MVMTGVRLEEEHFKKFNDTMGKCGLRLVTLRYIMLYFQYPIASMYGIFTYIFHRNQPNVGKYTSPMDGMGI